MTTPMRRVISVLPSATEMLCFLGGRNMLVGRSHEDNFPAGLEAVPIVTGQRTSFTTSAEVDAQVSAALAAGQSLYTLDEQLIRELRPDVILTQDICAVCAIDLVTVERLCATMEPRPLIVSLDPMNLGDVLRNLTQVGDAVGLEKEAAAAVAHLEARIARARATADAAVAQSGGFRPNVAFVEWPSPLYVGGHWTPQLLRLAGAEHPLNPARSDAEGAGKSFPVELQALARSEPELVIVAPCGLDLAACRREVETCLHEQAPWRQLGAVKAGRVALVDGDAMFNRPGPRLVDALEWLVWLLHNEESPLRPPRALVAGGVAEGAPAQGAEQPAGRSFAAGFAWDTLDGSAAGAPRGAAQGAQPPADMEDMVASAHAEAVRAGKLQYEDPATKYLVFTELASFGRGFCCGNACRHCPYGHAHAPPGRRKAHISRSLLVRAARDAAAAAAGDAAWREASALIGGPAQPELQLLAFDGSDAASRALAELRERCARTLPAERSRVEPLAVCFLQGGAHPGQLALGSTQAARDAMDAANAMDADLLVVVVPAAPDTAEKEDATTEAARALGAMRLALNSCVAPRGNSTPLALWLPASAAGQAGGEADGSRAEAYPRLAHATAARGCHQPLSPAVEVCELLLSA